MSKLKCQYELVATGMEFDNLLAATAMEMDAEADERVESKEEYVTMEKWLDDHPDFVQDYFARKATRGMIDAWLVSHALVHGSGSAPVQSSAEQSCSTSNSSRASSGTNTPVRKISAQEFEKGGQILKPMVSTIDGTPTFLSPGNVETVTKIPRKTKSELKALDEREIMYELVMDICNDLDVTSLCHKILQNVSILVNADRCSLFLVQGDKCSDNCCLVSKLFDVNSQATLEDCTERGQEIRVAWGSGIIGHVAKIGEPLNIPDAYEVSGSVLFLKAV